MSDMIPRIRIFVPIDAAALSVGAEDRKSVV